MSIESMVKFTTYDWIAVARKNIYTNCRIHFHNNLSIVNAVQLTNHSVFIMNIIIIEWLPSMQIHCECVQCSGFPTIDRIFRVKSSINRKYVINLWAQTDEWINLPVPQRSITSRLSNSINLAYEPLRNKLKVVPSIRLFHQSV